MVDELTSSVRVLEFALAGGVWAWDTARTTWAKIDDTGKRGIYAASAQAAPAVTLTLRRQVLSPANMLLQDGQYLLITAVRSPDRARLEVDAVKIRLSACVAEAQADTPGVSFPAVLSEKYINYAQPEPMSVNVITYVLVTPKEIDLRRGTLVQVDGTSYQVQTGHILDEYLNAFEIQRTVDL